MRRVSENDQDLHRYDDLLQMEHPVSKNHRHMSLLNRSAQFLPFAALTGYDDAITSARFKPETRIELSDTQIAELNETICSLEEHIKERPNIAIRYYKFEEEKVYEEVKMGKAQTLAKRRKDTKNGYYCVEKKQLRQIDRVHQRLVFTDRTFVSFTDILQIDFADLTSHE